MNKNDKILNQKTEENELNEENEENEEIEELPLDEFEIEQLITSDETLPTDIVYYHREKKEKRRMKVSLKGVSSTDMSIAMNQFQKAKGKEKRLQHYIIAQSLVDSQGEPVPLATIKKLDSGAEEKIVDEIYRISGYFENKEMRQAMKDYIKN